MIAKSWCGVIAFVASLNCAHGSQPRAQCPDLTPLANRLQTEHGALSFSAVQNPVTAQALLPDKQVPVKLLVLPSFEPQRAVYLRPKPGANEPVVADQGVPVPAQPEADEYEVVVAKADWETSARYKALLNGREWWKVPRTERDDLWRKALTVQSWSAPISKLTVRTLAVVWDKALLGARPLPRTSRPGCPEEIRLDGTDYVFANDYLDGAAPNVPGPRIAQLIALGEALLRFARAPVADRAAMEAKLQQGAAALEPEFDKDAR
jgi:hypothetical protein